MANMRPRIINTNMVRYGMVQYSMTKKNHEIIKIILFGKMSVVNFVYKQDLEIAPDDKQLKDKYVLSPLTEE